MMVNVAVDQTRTKTESDKKRGFTLSVLHGGVEAVLFTSALAYTAYLMFRPDVPIEHTAKVLQSTSPSRPIRRRRRRSLSIHSPPGRSRQSLPRSLVLQQRYGSTSYPHLLPSFYPYEPSSTDEDQGEDELDEQVEQIAQRLYDLIEEGRTALLSLPVSEATSKDENSGEVDGGMDQTLKRRRLTRKNLRRREANASTSNTTSPFDWSPPSTASEPCSLDAPSDEESSVEDDREDSNYDSIEDVAGAEQRETNLLDIIHRIDVAEKRKWWEN